MNLGDSQPYVPLEQGSRYMAGNSLGGMAESVVTGTKVGVGPGALNQVTTGTNNTAFGSGTGGTPYGITTGSGNVMVAASAGHSCSNGSNNTFIGSNTAFKA